MKPRDVICTECFHTTLQSTRSVAFPGLAKYLCPRCRRTFLHPAAAAQRVLTWLLLAGLSWATVRSLLEGGTAIPGLMGGLLFLGVLRDLRAARKVREAARRVSTSGARAARADLLATHMGFAEPASPVRPHRTARARSHSV